MSKNCWEAVYNSDESWVCPDCGHGKDICQDKDEGMRGYMARAGQFSPMSAEEKRSYDLHHPEFVGDFDD